MHSILLNAQSAPGRNLRGNISIHQSKPRIEPMVKENWPRWALKIEKHPKRVPSDIGVGDTLVHIIGDGFSARFKRLTGELGINCGCTNRQRWLNARFPYQLSGD
jgi:hypothetical protein